MNTERKNQNEQQDKIPGRQQQQGGQDDRSKTGAGGRMPGQQERQGDKDRMPGQKSER